MRRSRFVAGLIVVVVGIMLVVFSFVYPSLFCQGECAVALLGLASLLRLIGVVVLVVGFLVSAFGAYSKPAASQ
jgi:protein-S-isoprenylcysteine O-methyltransferase Ste14